MPSHAPLSFFCANLFGISYGISFKGGKEYKIKFVVTNTANYFRALSVFGKLIIGNFE